jgi:hypothetical protein
LLDHLELANPFAECLALAGVGHRGLVGRLGDPQRLSGDADAACVQHRHRDLEPLAFTTQPVLRRAPVVLKVDLAGRGSADAQLGLALARLKARFGSVDDKGGHTPMARLGIGVRLGKEQHIPGHRPTGDPGFGAIQEIVRAIG